MKSRLIAESGSVQNIDGIPADLKELYRTVWEIKQKALIDMAADRAAYIDQSQSLNIFLSEPDHNKLTSMHFYGWKKGLKTGMYYLRTKPASQAIQFTVDPTSNGVKNGGSSSSTRETGSNRSTNGSVISMPPETIHGDVCTSCSG